MTLEPVCESASAGGGAANLQAFAGQPHCGTRTTRPALFRSFFLGGFECSSHRRRDGRRLDLIAATRHDLLALEDYRQLSEHGIRAARDGVRWHRVEAVPGYYDWSPVLPMLRAAETAGIQVVWDLCHYGWPDHLDIFSGPFVEHFARYAAASPGSTSKRRAVHPWSVPSTRSLISPGPAGRWGA